MAVVTRYAIATFPEPSSLQLCSVLATGFQFATREEAEQALMDQFQGNGVIVSASGIQILD